MIKSYFLFITKIYERIKTGRYHTRKNANNSPLWSWIGVKSYKRAKKSVREKQKFQMH